MPFRSVRIAEPDCNLDVTVWHCDENVCERRKDGKCDTTAAICYGSAEGEDTKFCPRHFYERHYGQNAAYRLVDIGPLSKCDVATMVNKASDAFWAVIVRQFPCCASGDLSPERTIDLGRAQEAAVNEWITNNVNPHHREGTAHGCSTNFPPYTDGEPGNITGHDPAFHSR